MVVLTNCLEEVEPVWLWHMYDSETATVQTAGHENPDLLESHESRSMVIEIKMMAMDT